MLGLDSKVVTSILPDEGKPTTAIIPVDSRGLDRDQAYSTALAVKLGMRTVEQSPSINLGTTWEQLRPNTGENGGVGPTRKQDESTR